MNISYRWLRDLAPGIPDSPQGVAERLAMLGAPVDEIVELGADLGDVVIARVDRGHGRDAAGGVWCTECEGRRVLPVRSRRGDTAG